MKATCRGYSRHELDRTRPEREITAARERLKTPGERVDEYGWLFDWQLETQLMEAERNG